MRVANANLRWIAAKNARRHVAKTGVIRGVLLGTQKRTSALLAAPAQLPTHVVVAHATVEHRRVGLERHFAKGTGRRVVVSGDARRAVEFKGPVIVVAEQHRFGAALIARAAETVARAPREPRGSGKRRGAGNEVDHAADGVGTVQHRGRAADDFHTIHRRYVDQRRQFAEILLATRVVQAKAIFEKQNALTALAANARSLLIRADADHVGARHFAQQVGRGIGLFFTEARAVNHADRRGHVVDICFLSRGGHGHGLQGTRPRRGRIGIGFIRRSLLREQCEREGERHGRSRGACEGVPNHCRLGAKGGASRLRLGSHPNNSESYASKTPTNFYVSARRGLAVVALRGCLTPPLGGRASAEPPLAGNRPRAAPARARVASARPPFECRASA